MISEFGFGFGMSVAVYFDDELFFWAPKIDDEVLDGVLTAKFEVVKLAVFEIEPEDIFKWGLIGAEFLAEGFEFWVVMNGHGLGFWCVVIVVDLGVGDKVVIGGGGSNPIDPAGHFPLSKGKTWFGQ